MTKDTEELKEFIIACLEEKKADNIDIIDLRSRNKLADYIIFASGRSTKNVGAIAEYIALELKQKVNINTNIEGLGKSEWVLIDAGTILVNIFYPEARAHFKLEEMWKNK
ncbi:ribosome silencing factor [Rickettsia endosymbiont of Halotydeus destructor]|uniref:ribosome silencing factor n=1 Tax=Rickettsia endosymbiont of Halotydeus destructor TaxID=2996754 RepID=UPI003BAE4A66